MAKMLKTKRTEPKNFGKLYTVLLPIGLIDRMKAQARAAKVPQRDLVRQFIERGLAQK